MDKIFHDTIAKYIEEQTGALYNLDIHGVKNLIDILTEAIKNNRNIWVGGNGGSQCSAMHFAEDMVKCVGLVNNKKVKCQALGINQGLVTCISNDINYYDIFSSELYAFANPGDVFIGLSVSGTSENLTRALVKGRVLGLTNVLITSDRFGEHQALQRQQYIDLIIKIKNQEFGHVEDATMCLFHFIVTYLSENLK